MAPGLNPVEFGAMKGIQQWRLGGKVPVPKKSQGEWHPRSKQTSQGEGMPLPGAPEWRRMSADDLLLEGATRETWTRVFHRGGGSADARVLLSAPF